MTDRRGGDDLFLDALEHDEDLAWELATAAARPAPPGLREAIVDPRRRARRTRRITLWSARVRYAYAAVVVLALLVGAVAARNEVDRARAQTAEYERVLAAVATGGHVVALAPSRGAGGRGALIVARTGEAYLVLEMPAPPAGKAYQAWVIRGGQPVRAGVAPPRPGVVTMRLEAPIRPGDIAAVTLEVAAGVDRPTGDPVLAGPF